MQKFLERSFVCLPAYIQRLLKQYSTKDVVALYVKPPLDGVFNARSRAFIATVGSPKIFRQIGHIRITLIGVGTKALGDLPR